MTRGYHLNVSYRRRLLTSLNPDVFHWYSAECAFEHGDLRKATIARANAMTAIVRGPRRAGVNDAKYLGGHPPGWPFSGCNPSRFRPYPRWPPSPQVLDAIRRSAEHSPGSQRFVYHGHGPGVEQLAPKLRRALVAIDAAGGLKSMTAARFTGMIRQALSPIQISAANHIHYALRKAGPSAMSQRSPLGVPPLLLEYVHARVSLDAFAQATALRTDGQRAEHAQRDDSYYWLWT